MKRFGFSIVLLFAALSLLPGFAAAQDDPIEISFVHIFSDDFRPLVLQSIIDEYNEANSGVIVTAETAVADSSYEETFNAALRTADQGDAYNIVQVESGLTQQAIDSGYFAPISGVASEEQLATLDDLLPSVRGFFDVGEDFWAMPWNISNPVMFINRDMFAAAGLDPDSPPRTFAEVTAACEALMTAEALDLQGCINWPMDAWFALQWIAMQGQEYVNNDNGRSGRADEVLFTSDPMLDIATWWGDLAANGYYIYDGSTGSGAYNAAGISFLTGQTAMTINSTAGLALFQQFALFDLGVEPLIVPNEDATLGVTIGGGALWLAVDQSDEELQAANDFVFFLTNAVNGAVWHAGSGYLPIRFSSVEYLENLPEDNTLLVDPETGERVALPAANWFEANPAFSIAFDQLANTENTVATAGAVIGPSAEVTSILIQSFQSVVDNGANPLEALTAGAEQANAALADYNRDVE